MGLGVYVCFWFYCMRLVIDTIASLFVCFDCLVVCNVLMWFINSVVRACIVCAQALFGFAVVDLVPLQCLLCFIVVGLIVVLVDRLLVIVLLVVVLIRLWLMCSCCFV